MIAHALLTVLLLAVYVLVLWSVGRAATPNSPRRGRYS